MIILPHRRLHHISRIIIGNGPTTGLSSTSINSATGTQAAFMFTPNQGYTVTDVKLRLAGYIDNPPGDVPVVGIYTSTGSGASRVPNALVGSFTPPGSSASGQNTFTFNASGTIQLTAATDYWLVVDASAGSFTWNGAASGTWTGDSAANATPYKTSTDNGANYSAAFGSPAYGLQINGYIL